VSAETPGTCNLCPVTFGVLDLLAPRGFDLARAKFMRHAGAAAQDCYARGLIEEYQRFQGRKLLDGTDLVASFIADEGTGARLLGVYRVGPRRAAPVPPAEQWQDAAHYYPLDRESGYEDLEGRVVVEWGAGALAWCQRATNKPVLEIRRAAVAAPPADYMDVRLSHAELRAIVSAGDREWRSRLSAVAGVYLILDSASGMQYVGSASGDGGIWGRWSEYARTGHGGNAELQALDPARFAFSILRVLPATTARAEVVDAEAKYKAKLGSRAHGLNGN
jgi:hypothetical protein